MKLFINNFSFDDKPNWLHIFNSPFFFELHKNNHSYFLKILNDNEVICICHFKENSEKCFISPINGTFGSLSFNKKLKTEEYIEIYRIIEVFLSQKGAKKIIINTPPFIHDVYQNTIILNLLMNNGYKIEKQEINHHLIVTNLSFKEIIKRNNKKKLNQCINQNFEFYQVFGEDEFKKVYNIIKKNRDFNGYKTSMSFEEIIKMQLKFSDDLFFFKVTYNNIDIASSICIKINSEILYVFYWGDLPEYRNFSPVVFIANGIYNFAKENNFKLIDAGTSSINGEINVGVSNFKENLGFEISPKLTFCKII
jgi:hypothetical protein